jgi:hypothetical protein
MRDVSCVVDAAIAHENRMRQIHPRPDVGYRLVVLEISGTSTTNQLVDVRTLVAQGLMH